MTRFNSFGRPPASGAENIVIFSHSNDKYGIDGQKITAVFHFSGRTLVWLLKTPYLCRGFTYAVACLGQELGGARHIGKGVHFGALSR